MKPIILTLTGIALLAACASNSAVESSESQGPNESASFAARFGDEGPFPQVRYYVINDL